MIDMLKITGLFFLLCLSILCVNCAGNNELIKKKAKAKENMGLSYIQQGNVKAGIGYLIEAAELDAEDANIQHELALAYKDLDVYGEALIHFKRALALKPDFPEAWNNLGTLYLLHEEWDLGIGCFEKAVGSLTYRTPYFAYNNLGLAYYNKKEYNRAIECFHKAINLSPSYAISYANLGLTYEAMRRLEDAINAYEKAISLDPDSSMAHFGLGKIYLNLNRKAEATLEFQKTTEIDPGGTFAKEAGKLLSNIN
jgi:type IV pilus assembly protein PilF